MDISDLTQYATEALGFMKDLDSDKKEYTGQEIPQQMNLQIDGISSTGGIDLLFAPYIDKIMDKLLDLFISGDYNQILDKLNNITSIFSKGGIGRGFFDGDVSKTIINSIKNSTRSLNYNKTNSKIKKALIIVRNLKRQMRKIPDPETRKKYEDAVYALTALTKMLKSIYKNRKYLNDRVLKGLKNFVFESNEIVKIEKIEI